MRGVAISGVGIVSALGSGLAAHLAGLREGRSGLRPLTLFPAEDLGGLPVGEVAAGLVPRNRAPRCIRLALRAARQALAGRRLEGEGVLCVGTTTGGIFESEAHYLKHRGGVGAEDRGLLLHHPTGAVADVLTRTLRLSASEHTFSTACSSSANAIGFGASMVEREGKWALVGGVDSLSRITYAGFHALKLLTSAPCRPFDLNRRGLSLGEGAAFFLLEPEEEARRRGTPILGFVRGWGCTSDAHHPTAPHPRGEGAATAMLSALADAGLDPAQVDYVNAHGTATPANDLAEGLALERVFGARPPLTSSTKGLTGHTLGAAGAIEAVLSLAALSSGFVPATAGLEQPDPEIHIRHVPPGGVNQPLSVVLSSSFGFGGNNAVLVLSRAAE
ncbi:MAG: beta-ketoacyl-[acyl-carrier-protein] synthase family protein [Myxococcaceae bacterium]